MPLSPGTRIGSYEVMDALGAGGMGEVYRARDSKLNRDVAIKVLPELASADADRMARFAREAQLLAALNHPNIAQIYGLEETQDGHALVMELVDGSTVAELIGTLSIDEALAIARQIAEALEAAHEKAIIHRDMKPGNVMVTADGHVKVLDFGLGKALDAESSVSVSDSPTMTVRATQAGMILGTAGYMSPEQAKGRGADKRSDVWAFGCILYEMLSGRRAFEGEGISDTLASVLRGDPDWSALPANLPPAIRTLIERCLVKDRTRRISDISTAKFLLSEPGNVTSLPSSASGPAASAPRSIRLSLALAALAATVVVTAGLMWTAGFSTTSSATTTVTRLSVVLPPGSQLDDPDIVPIAMSPDGLHLAFTALAGGKIMLYQRALSESDSKVLAGTEGAQSPFFSFDGRWIGFFADGQLKKVALGGGALEVLCPAPVGRGGDWSEDGQIYFALTNRTGIWRVADTGGKPEEFTRLDRERGEVSHRWPQILPGNQGLIYTAWTGPGPDEKSVVLRTAAGEPRVLVRGGDRGRFASPGYLVFAKGDSLMALPFDPARPAPAGAVPVRLPGLIPGDSSEGAGFALSASGVLATLPAGPQRLARRLVWVDQTGRTEPLPVPAQPYDQVSISPDGTQAVVAIVEGVVNLWLYDFARESLTPFVKAGSSSQAAIWTPDNRWVIYRGTRNGLRNLYRKAADGTGVEERLTMKEGVNQTPHSVSPDGNWLVFAENGGDTGGDLFKVNLSGEHKVEPLITSPINERSGMISPAGGVWLAFTTDDSGREEVFVRPFPGQGRRISVSRDGGHEPHWSPDGKRLYFVNGDAFMAADMTFAPSASAGVPKQLYAAPFSPSSTGATSYSVLREDRVLRVQPVQPDPPATRIDIVLNWREELRRLVR